MEEKKRTIVMFGDSLTDYFPMEKLKDIDAQFINSGVAGDTIAEMGARLAYDVFPYKPDIIIMQGGFPDVIVSRSKSFSGTIDQTCTKDSAAIARYKDLY